LEDDGVFSQYIYHQNSFNSCGPTITRVACWVLYSTLGVAIDVLFQTQVVALISYAVSSRFSCTLSIIIIMMPVDNELCVSILGKPAAFIPQTVVG
jgi:hypothetical protein